MSEPVIPPVVKEVVVPVDQATAFRVFTEQVDRWWPLASHSVSGSAARGLRLDPEGFVETLPDGTQSRWGSMLAWDPPQRVAMTWHPGRQPDPHTQVEVTFAAVAGGTLVRLVHSGWEALGLDAAQVDASTREYRAGWDVVLGHYVQVVGEASVA